jgi:hypothetical protein
MLCFNWFYHCLYVIVLIQYNLYPYTIAIPTTPGIKHDINSHSNNQVKYRCQRSVINFLSDTNEPKHQSGDNSPIITTSDNVGPPSSAPANNWLKLIQQQTGRVVQGATDVVLTPVHWLTHMQTYW